MLNETIITPQSQQYSLLHGLGNEPVDDGALFISYNMKSEEIWKDIPGYEGLYQVSTFGRVKSLDRVVGGQNNTTRRIKGKLKVPQQDDKGYSRTMLHVNNLYKLFLVHRLVAITFIPNPLNLPQVNHKDENPKNSHVDNLEWCTHAYSFHRLILVSWSFTSIFCTDRSLFVSVLEIEPWLAPMK